MPGRPLPAPATPPGNIPPGRRSNARVRLHIPARLILLSGVQHCILEDLSVTGAAIIPQETLPPVGTSGILQCNGVEAFGNIQWSRYGRCGIMFDEPLPLANVIALRHVADAYEDNERERFRDSARAWVQGSTRHM
ncbi:hypothetical protein GGQ88_002710 [Novosphingobium hassiacum]|uniref:PilZ domain-containing protein n=1 Tax=Novosphingobium hassiacum TaxID=173676 RepID=A0A7W5ZWW5_9SPHN|nr:PilZ domain-containing protein [Novosphingobium hassiacum]MBB3861426.1 hypothetical protein [Novosphingobium hassiacum]